MEIIVSKTFIVNDCDDYKNDFIMFFSLKEHFKHAWGQYSVSIIDIRSTLKNYTFKQKPNLYYIM